jgi:hypothetical protein
MSYRDDEEDLFISRSNEDAFKNPEKAKKEAREQKAKQEGELSDLKRHMLMQQVGADAAKADEETKRLQKLHEDEKAKDALGTKTREQQQEEFTLDAQTEVTAEQQIEANREEEETKDQAQQEYQNEDG